MDMETQAVVNRLEAHLNTRFDRLEVKLDSHAEKLGLHDIAINTVSIEQGALKARFVSHKREHSDSNKWWLSMAAGVILLWLKIGWDWIVTKGGSK